MRAQNDATMASAPAVLRRMGASRSSMGAPFVSCRDPRCPRRRQRSACRTSRSCKEAAAFAQPLPGLDGAVTDGADSVSMTPTTNLPLDDHAVRSVARELAMRAAAAVGLAGIALIHLLDSIGKYHETRYVFWMYIA